MRGVRHRLGLIALEVWVPAALVVAWWLSSANSTSVYFPPLRNILQSFRNAWLFSQFGSEVVPSLVRFALGTLIAVVAGVLVGTTIGLMPTVHRALNPFIDFFRSLPMPALLPMAIVFLGIGNSMKISIIAFGAVWPVLLNAIDGARGVDQLQLDMSQVYGLSRKQRVFKVILPSASPQIFVGVRLALAIGLILMVVSEMVASTNGLGYYVLQNQQTFSIPQMWSGIILLGLIGYVINFLFLLCERRVLAWHAGWRATAQGKGMSTSKKRVGGKAKAFDLQLDTSITE